MMKIAVVGGGPAGLMAAETAAAEGASRFQGRTSPIKSFPLVQGVTRPLIPFKAMDTAGVHLGTPINDY
ncbi:MAG: hypothetical protein NNA23_08285 [Nitrospira sp.]|nr:hypothetical protein [Nitrospira sp.]MCP9464660.1 hypothetical protein [Nitrospira sp.]